MSRNSGSAVGSPTRRLVPLAAVNGVFVLLTATVILFGIRDGSGSPGRFLSVTLLVFGLYLLGIHWTFTHTRQSSGREPITLATWVTSVRGSTLALLSGVALAGPLTGALVWVPGGLFAVTALLDAVDGTIARQTESVTAFGSRLDTETDAVTVLIGSVLVVEYGAAPIAFLAVGGARYLFVAGASVRRRRGLSVTELDRSHLRRLLGGLAMAAIWVGLLPIPGTAISRLIASVVLVPFVGQFLRDWLVASGRR